METCLISNSSIELGNEEFLIEALRLVVSQVDAFVVPNNSARIENLSNLMFLRSILKDNESKNEYDKLLVKLFAIDFMNKKRACSRFIVHNDEFWEEIHRIEENIDIPNMENYGDYGDNVIFKESFAMDPYSYKDICRVNPGDVVIDCGAYVGDTAYVFNEKMGGCGFIYAFEPLPENFIKLKKNIEYLKLQDKIMPINAGVADKEGKISFSCNENNHGASRINSEGNIQIDVTTIDAFFEANSTMSKVDFIKMDIEGAEVSALKGAKNIIKRFRPRLAICIYHKVEDHWEIPQLILSIDDRYEFYLRHHTENNTETVLYCVPVDYTPCRCDKNIYDNQMIDTIQKLYIETHRKLRANARWSDNKYKELEQNINEMKESTEYRFGKLVTFIPRKIRNTKQKTKR